MATRIVFYVGSGKYVQILRRHVAPICDELAKLGITASIEETAPSPDPSVFSIIPQMELSKVVDFYIDHGLADKGFVNAKNVAGYKWVGVRGSAWFRKLVSQGRASETLLYVDYPLLDHLFQKRPPRSDYIFWAPTHQAVTEVSSAPAFRKFLPMIEEKSPPFLFKLVQPWTRRICDLFGN